jgi:hypothetical protein
MEQIKKKLDAMNKAAGFDPNAAKIERAHANNSMPSNEIFDMIGAGAQRYLQQKKDQEKNNL